MLGTLVLQGAAKIFLNSLFLLQNFVIFRLTNLYKTTSAKVNGSFLMCFACRDDAALLL